MKKNLPIGISSFEKIRSEPYYYVDKTPFVAKLVEEGTYYFLSRPRRFGKSLFVDTLKQAFLGKKELFQGLYLEKNWDWSVRYPVIHISFGAGNILSEEDFLLRIKRILKKNYKTLQLDWEDSSDYRASFEDLIEKAYEKYKAKVVVLIDEYDKPILDRIENKELSLTLREHLKNLYGVIKDADVYLKFVFITGVSKFSKVSLFSGLNQLNDITLDKRFAEICGYTQKELEEVFREELQDKDLELIRCWYNGYSWLGEPVYNPFDVLLYLEKRTFHPYWFETGTPSFLVKLLLEKRFYLPELEDLTATDDLIGTFDLDYIEPENLLFQVGYLTIKETIEEEGFILYKLSYPNKEVKISLNRVLFSYFTQLSSERPRLSLKMIEAVRERDFEKMKKTLEGLYAGIPHDWFRKNELFRYEGYYASCFYAFLCGSGLEVIPEDITNKGQIDLTVLYRDRVYLFEFKVVEGEEGEGKALAQLKEKGYHKKYEGSFKEIYLIGIEFSSGERNIKDFSWEKIN
ncbi:ATP-binding protein [Thermodesulfovibrio sp. TK110]